MDLWELVSLELDYPGKEIGEYFEKESGLEIKRVKCDKKGSYYKKTEICDIVNKALGESTKRKLVVYGSGDYHHFTYGLCKHADKISEKYAYIHFDHHRDSYQRGKGMLDCGSFVPDILEDTNTSAVLFIGTAEYRDKLAGKPQFSIRCPKERKLMKKLEKLPEEVYLTFDLDVMDTSEIITSYNQGSLLSKRLMECISIIKNNKRIIGADVLGYARPKKDFSGKKLYARIVKEILTQDSPNPHQSSNPS